jgi:hypothetical protein
MKTLINNLTKLAILAVLTFAGVTFADAASFDTNPSNTTGTVSIIEGSCSDCGGQFNSVAIPNLAPGESVDVNVFTDYMVRRNSSQWIYNATVRYLTQDATGGSSSFNFQTRLRGDGASDHVDFARVTNLPSQWSIEAIDGHIQNTHGQEDPQTCPGPAYNYFQNAGSSIFSSGGRDLGDLTTLNGGWCSQGTAVVRYRITNTASSTSYSWETGDWGACISGIETRDVFCVNDQTGTVVSDSNCDAGDEPNNTRTCQNQDDLVVETDPATNIGENSARLNGDLISGGPAFQLFFALSATDTTPECNGNDDLYFAVGNQIGSGTNPNFFDDANDLNDDTTYYYRACAQDGSQTASGNVRNFTTDEDGQITTYSWQTGPWGACINGIETRDVFCENDQTGTVVSDSNCDAGDEPNNTRSCGEETYSWQAGPWGACINNVQERDVICVDSSGDQVSDSNCTGNEPASSQVCTNNGNNLNVDTLDATDVDVNSAQLNGDLISGGPADQYWFVLSSSDSTPGCNDFGGIQILFPNLDEGEIGGGNNPNFSDEANGLSDDTTYYYRACVRVGTTTDEGDVESFTTDSAGNNPDDEPQAETREEDDVDDNSAELNGRIRMNDFDDGIVFFVYGQDEDRVDDIEDNYDSFTDAASDEDNDEFEVVLVEPDADHSGWESYSEDVGGLEEDERYYYQICVEYNDNGDELECGGLESFQTEDDGDDDDDDPEIRTTRVEDVGATFATLCGDLEDDGGDNSLRTRIEFRRNDGFSPWIGSTYRQRGEGNFCVEVNGLQPDTRYQYRACTDEGDCGNVRNFTTNPINLGGPVAQVNVNTLNPTAVSNNFAVLNGAFQGSPNEPTQVWFEWGRTAALGTQKRIFTRNAVAGTFSDSFSSLRACTQYYYRAVARNSTGIRYGNIISFRTSCIIDTGGPTVVTQPPVVTVVDDVESDPIDLDSLGLGLSLLRLEIDNEQGTLFRDQIVQYDVRWENISNIDLNDIDLKIAMPEEVEVTSISRGRFDADENLVFYNIEDLDEGDDGFMTITGVVTQGSLGDVITAEATAAYDNPINDAQENAIDYDIDEFVLNTNFGAASVFGLSNITFLGWLTILLGLLIIFLIARWLYLEREELRAQAYANGYRPQVYGDPRYDYNRGPASIAPNYGGGYQDPNQALGGNPNDASDSYQPYRPNRG